MRPTVAHRRVVRRLALVPAGLAALIAATALAPSALAQDGGGAVRDSEDEKIVLRVAKGEEIEVEELLKDIGIRRGQLILPDKQLRGVKIKFLNNFDVTWDMLRFVLEMNDIKIVEKRMDNGEVVMSAVLQRNLPQMSSAVPRFMPPEEVEANGIPDSSEILTAIIQVQNGAGNDIFSALRGLVTRDRDRVGNILYIRGPEVIIIVDLAPKVEYYYRVIKALDLPAPGQKIRVKQIVYAAADEIANTVNGLLRAQGPRVAQPGVVASQAQPQVIPDPRTNQIIIQAFVHEFVDIEEIIANLDIKVNPPPSNYYVYPVKNADAEELANKLNELFTGASPVPSRRSSRGGGRNDPRGTPGVSGRGITGQNTAPRPIASNRGAGLGAQGNLNPALGDIQTRIVSHEPTNSLLIQAEPVVYSSILKVLAELDRKAKRVGIEAQVWEVAVPNDDLFIAVELAATDNASDESTRVLGATSFGISQIAFDPDQNRLLRIPNIANGVIGVVAKDAFDKLPLILRALHSSNKSRLITQTSVFTNDNESATLTVSDSFPFFINSVNNVAATQGVDFAEAASTMTITPQIASGDQLTLELDLDIQSFTGGAVGGLPPPSNSRRYQGIVTIPNMKWVVFGGLEREAESVVEDKIPFLGDIPLLGYLFKSHQSTKNKTKIYIFVRPIILTDEDFRDHVRLSALAQEKIYRESELDRMPEPIMPAESLRDPYGSVHDSLYELFGTTSQNPFPEYAANNEGYGERLFPNGGGSVENGDPVDEPEDDEEPEDEDD